VQPNAQVEKPGVRAVFNIVLNGHGNSLGMGLSVAERAIAMIRGFQARFTRVSAFLAAERYYDRKSAQGLILSTQVRHIQML